MVLLVMNKESKAIQVFATRKSVLTDRTFEVPLLVVVNEGEDLLEVVRRNGVPAISVRVEVE